MASYALYYDSTMVSLGISIVEGINSVALVY
jgi:hypothetical protein